MQHSVPNQGYLLKWLIKFLRLNPFNSNMLFSEGYFGQNNWNKVLQPLDYNNI